MCTSAGGTRGKSLRLFLMSLRHRWMAGESIPTILFSPSLPLLERASPCSLGRVFVVGRTPKRVSLRIIRIRVHTRSPTATREKSKRERFALLQSRSKDFVSPPPKKQTSTKSNDDDGPSSSSSSSSSSAASPFPNKSLFRQSTTRWCIFLFAENVVRLFPLSWKEVSSF